MNKDLISRQDAIKEVSKYVHSVDMIIGNGTLSMEGCKDTAEEILEGLPSMEPELDCTLKEFGDCSYSETGCSDCKIKNKIRTALNITLCKDCKYWVVEEDEAYCYRIIMVHGAKDGSGFCSDAKRKMDNE